MCQRIKNKLRNISFGLPETAKRHLIKKVNQNDLKKT